MVSFFRSLGHELGFVKPPFASGLSKKEKKVEKRDRHSALSQITANEWRLSVIFFCTASLPKLVQKSAFDSERTEEQTR